MKTLAELLRYRVRLRSADVANLFLGIARGALALQRSRSGRSHGNIAAATVVVGDQPRLHAGRVKLLEPLTGEARQAIELERADLRAIGLLLYQVVRCRGSMPEDELVRLTNTVEPTPEWQALFGPETPKWVGLCNRLLDPALDLSEANLACLEGELLALTPKPLLRKAALPSAVLLLVAAAAGAYVFWPRQVLLEIAGNLPGAQVELTDAQGRKSPAPLRLPESGKSLRVRLQPGTNWVVLSFPGLDAATNMIVLSRTNRAVRVDLAYGGVVLNSTPPGAAVERLALAGEPLEKQTAPYTNRFLKPAVYRFGFQLNGYDYRETKLAIAAGAITNVVVELARSAPGATNLATVSVRPENATIAYGNEETAAEGSIRRKLPAGLHSFTLRLGPRFATNYAVVVPPVGPEGFRTNLTLPHARLSFTSTPAGAEVWALPTNLLGQTPLIDLGWPLGLGEFEVRKAGHKTNSIRTNLVAEAARVELESVLEPLGGLVELAANLPPAFASNVVLTVLSNDLPLRTVSPLPAHLQLDRGAYTLVAAFSNLQAGVLSPVSTNLTVGVNTTNQVAFEFKFGQVSLVTRLTNATIELATPAGFVLGANAITRLQAPAAGETYVVRAPRHVPTNVSVTLTQSESLTLPPLELAPVLYRIAFTLDPPTARLLSDASRPARDDLGQPVPAPSGRNSFRWETGVRDFMLAHTNLPSRPVRVVLDEAMTDGVDWPPLRLAHGRVDIQTSPRGLTATVLSNDVPLGSLATPLADYVVRTNQPLRVRIGNERGVLTNCFVPALADGESFRTNYTFLPDVVTNIPSLGMSLRLVGDFYMSEAAVTRGQFLTVVSNGIGAEALRDLELKLESTGHTNREDAAECVTWDEAADFCARLTAQDRSHLAKECNLEGEWVYRLPTDAELGAAPPAPASFLTSYLVEEKTRSWGIATRSLKARAPLENSPEKLAKLRTSKVGFRVVLRPARP